MPSPQAIERRLTPCSTSQMSIVPFSVALTSVLPSGVKCRLTGIFAGKAGFQLPGVQVPQANHDLLALVLHAATGQRLAIGRDRQRERKGIDIGFEVSPRFAIREFAQSGTTVCEPCASWVLSGDQARPN